MVIELKCRVSWNAAMTKLPMEPPVRYGTREAIDRLNKLLGFQYDCFEQDWEIERADAARLAEFVNIYRTETLNDDEQFTLMGLIIASSHDAFDFGHLTDELWRSIHHLLVTQSQLHASTIFDWCCVEATCSDECFTLTPLMRKVWVDAFPNNGSFEAIKDG